MYLVHKRKIENFFTNGIEKVAYVTQVSTNKNYFPSNFVICLFLNQTTYKKNEYNFSKNKNDLLCRKKKNKHIFHDKSIRLENFGVL